MEYYEIPFIVFIGFISGFLNTVAGGGSLISVPVLIIMGMPGTMANATSRVAILSQNIFAVGGFYSKGLKLPMPYTLFLCVVSLCGGLVGAQIAVTLSDRTFNRILAIVMVLALLATLGNHWKGKGTGGEDLGKGKQALGIVGFFLLGIYGGFIQAGIGFFVIALLTGLHRFDLVKVNFIKVFAALLYTGIALVVFALEGKVNWAIGIVLAIGQGLGGWWGSRWSVAWGEQWIKWIVWVAVTGMAVKLWFF